MLINVQLQGSFQTIYSVLSQGATYLYLLNPKLHTKHIYTIINGREGQSSKQAITQKL